MSIIESLLVLRRLVAQANQSVGSQGNGRQATYVDRPLRLTAAPRERPGCSPASIPPEGTSWPFSRCTDARTLPGSAAGALPRRAFCTCKRKRNQKGAGEGGRPEQAKNPERLIKQAVLPPNPDQTTRARCCRLVLGAYLANFSGFFFALFFFSRPLLLDTPKADKAMRLGVLESGYPYPASGFARHCTPPR